jgi:ATP-dependent DNA ligase
MNIKVARFGKILQTSLKLEINDTLINANHLKLMLFDSSRFDGSDAVEINLTA